MSSIEMIIMNANHEIKILDELIKTFQEKMTEAQERNDDYQIIDGYLRTIDRFNRERNIHETYLKFAKLNK